MFQKNAKYIGRVNFQFSVYRVLWKNSKSTVSKEREIHWQSKFSIQCIPRSLKALEMQCFKRTRNTLVELNFNSVYTAFFGNTRKSNVSDVYYYDVEFRCLRLTLEIRNLIKKILSNFPNFPSFFFSIPYGTQVK